MPKLDFICAHDPHHPEAVGAVVSTSRQLQVAEAAGAVFLPLDPNLLRTFQLGGFVRRSWGKPGWIFNLNRGEGGSPLALQVQAGNSLLHWAAEIAVVPSVDGKALATGKLQLALVRSAVGVLSPGFSQADQPQPFQFAQGQSLLLRGAVQLNTLIDGFVAVQLWGVCSQVAVRWVAVSQSGAAS